MMRIKDTRKESKTSGQLIDIPVEEKEFLLIIKKIVGRLAQSFKFGIYDRDDISQEIAILGMEALPNWDNTRPLYSFLLAHISNRLINLKRNKWYRASCPCSLCDGKLEGETGHKDKKHCKKFLNWKSTNSSKANIAAPNLIPKGWDSIDILNEPIDNMSNQELEDYIDIHLPIKLRSAYLKIKSGVRVNHDDKEAVLLFLRGLLNGN